MKRDHSESLEGIAAKSGRSPLDVLETFLERAAIREYDGMYSRDEAERMALGDVTEMLRRNHDVGATTTQLQLGDICDPVAAAAPSQQPAITVRS